MGVTEKFDLIADNSLDGADIREWLSQASAENGFGAAYLRGDTDGLDPNSVTRTSLHSLDVTLQFDNHMPG